MQGKIVKEKIQTENETKIVSCKYVVSISAFKADRETAKDGMKNRNSKEEERKAVS